MHAHHLPQPPDTPDLHGFVMLGTDPLCLAHLPMFYMENHCYQLIFEATLSREDRRTYVQAREANPGVFLILGNHAATTLAEIVTARTFQADAFVGMPADPATTVPFMRPTVEVGRIILFRHFDPAAGYPDRLTYFLYGTPREPHLSHLITAPPNFQQELDLASAPPRVTDVQLARGVVIALPAEPEAARQLITADPLGDAHYAATVEGGGHTAITIERSHFFDAVTINMGGAPEIGSQYWFGDDDDSDVQSRKG